MTVGDRVKGLPKRMEGEEEEESLGRKGRKINDDGAVGGRGGGVVE